MKRTDSYAKKKKSSGCTFAELSLSTIGFWFSHSAPSFWVQHMSIRQFRFKTFPGPHLHLVFIFRHSLLDFRLLVFLHSLGSSLLFLCSSVTSRSSLSVLISCADLAVASGPEKWPSTSHTSPTFPTLRFPKLRYVSSSSADSEAENINTRFLPLFSVTLGL